MDKFELNDKIKLAYLRYRGNASEVAATLSLPIEFVRKVVGKFKKAESRDVSVRVSNMLMQQVLLGYESRVRNLQDMLDKLSGREQCSVSPCCHKPVVLSGDSVITCQHCGKNVERVITIDKESIYRLRQELVVALRDEDKFLVDFADKMGYTNKPPVEQVPAFQQRNYQFVLKKGEMPPELEGVMGDIRKLSPTDREKFRKKLESKLVDGVVDDKEEGEAPSK